MTLVYFEDAAGRAVALVLSQIVGIQQNRLPTETPTTVILVSGQSLAVRNSFDECNARLLMSAKDKPTDWSAA